MFIPDNKVWYAEIKVQFMIQLREITVQSYYVYDTNIDKAELQSQNNISSNTAITK